LIRQGRPARQFHAITALPLRLRADTIGALNLFYAQSGPVHEEDLVAAQALADVATIGILAGTRDTAQRGARLAAGRPH
jgi:hypothetical protein